MLALKRVHLTLGKGSRLQKQVVRDLTFSIRKGEFVILIGKNGSGKSTLLQLISGFYQPNAGKIQLDQREITPLSQQERAREIATVMQDPKMGTMEQMTLYENMALAYRRGSPRFPLPFTCARRKKLFQEQLSLLHMGLEERLEEQVSQLSGGERQALSLIMALLRPAKLLLLDEITAALDPKAANRIMQIADELICREQLTTLLVTHNMDHASKYGDRILLLAEGGIVREFSKEQKRRLSPSSLAAYLQETSFIQ